MRLIHLEIKRILKGPLPKICIAAALLFAFFLAYIPATYAYCYSPESGNYLTGFKAIEARRELRKEVEGTVTSEDIRGAISQYKEVLRKYGVDNMYELPNEGEYELEKIKPLLHGIQEAYGSDDGLGADIAALSVENIQDFYAACVGHLKNNMELEQPNHPAAQKAAMDLYGRIDIPFSYYYGISSSAVEYEGILILMVLLCCTLICSPVFSLEYQTGSDSILRCTKRGRKELAIYKILASLIISTVLYFICMTIWIGLSYLFWGKEGMGTSIQMLFSSISLFKGNAGDMLVMLAGCGILMIISSVCLTLFVSSVTQNTMVSLALSFLLCFMPIIMGWFMPENISNVAKALFPSGGIGLNNGILYDLIDFRFLNIGNLAIWTPFLIVSVALIEIPVWFYMGVKKYKGHVMK